MQKQAVKRKVNPLNRFPWSHTQQATNLLTTPVVYGNKIEGFIDNVDTLIEKRTNRLGKKDPVAKKLKKASSSAKGYMRRKNIVNEDLTKSLKQIKQSLKGASNVPKQIRSKYQQLSRYLKNHVRENVVKFCRVFHKSLQTIGKEIHSLERQLERQLQAAKKGSAHLVVDPAIKRRFQSIDRRISQFKTKWGKKLNQLSTHGNRSVQSSVNKIKRELETLQKSIRHSISLINRASKSKKSKQGARKKNLLTKREAESLQKHWQKYETALNQFQTEMQQFTEQLKATKSI